LRNNNLVYGPYRLNTHLNKSLSLRNTKLN